VAALQRQIIDAVGAVIKVCADEGIDADIHHGGTVAVATTDAQLARLRATLEADRRWGLGPDDSWELNRAEVADCVAVAGARGGLFSPHCARVHPARLVRGLADAVERRNVRIYEGTAALSVEPRRVRTARGDVIARWVVRATEGFTAQLPNLHRRLLPMNSSMVVTEPLPDDVWARIGWQGAETLRDAAHVYVYAQRTADGRIAFGGRGVPYRFRSRTDTRGATRPATAAALAGWLRRTLPQVGDVELAHAWCGVLGVARDWCPAVVADPATGVAWAGGYVGDGVTTSHLAGRTLADLIVGDETERTRLPWVGHVSRQWEPEPFRWLGVRTVYALYRAADRAEAHPGAGASRWASLANLIAGRR
jgi:glycine/D-amino acid oxidase-like deaminating enzyme